MAALEITLRCLLYLRSSSPPTSVCNLITLLLQRKPLLTAGCAHLPGFFIKHLSVSTLCPVS